jgi:CelD/BcsL family acetyltransferase involved in cellulose biosynthesis
MDVEVVPLDFGRLTGYWLGKPDWLDWSGPFVLPPWLQSWWQIFGRPETCRILAGFKGKVCCGMAPFQQIGGTATFLGDTDTCDYQDMVTGQEYRQQFTSAILQHLAGQGAALLKLRHIRPESPTWQALNTTADQYGYSFTCRQEAVSLEMELPGTWLEYLALLEKKERHEIRRKLRRLEHAGSINFYFTRGPAENGRHLELFLEMFALNRPAKAEFMNERMKSFFRVITGNMGQYDLVRFGCLEMDGRKVAIIMVFDYNNTIYLYNSAFDPAYGRLGVGLMSKVLAIRQAIFMGRSKWDFLKGDEPYKQQLGGRKIALYGLELKID